MGVGGESCSQCLVVVAGGSKETCCVGVDLGTEQPLDPIGRESCDLSKPSDKGVATARRMMSQVVECDLGLIAKLPHEADSSPVDRDS
ncbi:MAG: hypothetical protein ACYDH6_13910 [Acidimicrobiales bacterium]